MLKSLLSALVLATFSVNSLAVELKGHLTQGGLVTGKLSDVQSVSLNDTPLKLSKNGDFVFGFGRDAKQIIHLAGLIRMAKSIPRILLLPSVITTLTK